MTSLVLPSGPHGRRDRRVQELLFDIKDAALRQLSDNMGSGISYRGISAELGVSRATLRYHFATRDALIEALVADGFTNLERSLAHARDRTAHAAPSRRLLAVAETYRAWALRHRRHYLVMHTRPVGGDGSGDDEPRGTAKIVRILVELMRDSLDRDVFDTRFAGLVGAEEHLAGWRRATATGADVPDAVLAAALVTHARLHGAVSHELNARTVTGGLDDERLFEAQVHELARLLRDGPTSASE